MEPLFFHVMGYLLLFLAGAVSGVFYFGGLWLTLKRTLNRPRGMVWIFVSFVVRTAVVTALFFSLMKNDFYRILVLMAGFLGMRYLFTSKIKLPDMKLSGAKTNDLLSRSDHPL